METSRLSRFLLSVYAWKKDPSWSDLDWDALSFFSSCLFKPDPVWFGTQSVLGPVSAPFRRALVFICVQRLPCLFSLWIPESLCNPLPFAASEHRNLSSALNRHGTNELLYFVCQTLPTCLFILLQSPNELVQKKEEEKTQEKESVCESGRWRWAGSKMWATWNGDVWNLNNKRQSNVLSASPQLCHPFVGLLGARKACYHAPPSFPLLYLGLYISCLI